MTPLTSLGAEPQTGFSNLVALKRERGKGEQRGGAISLVFKGLFLLMQHCTFSYSVMTRGGRRRALKVQKMVWFIESEAVLLLLWKLLPRGWHGIRFHWSWAHSSHKQHQREMMHLHWELDTWLGKVTSPTKVGICVCVCVRVFGKDESRIVHSKLCPSRTLCWPNLHSLCSFFPCQFLTYMLTGRKSSEMHIWLSSDGTLLVIIHCLLWPSSTLTQFWLP